MNRKIGCCPSKKKIVLELVKAYNLTDTFNTQHETTKKKGFVLSVYENSLEKLAYDENLACSSCRDRCSLHETHNTTDRMLYLFAKTSVMQEKHKNIKNSSSFCRTHYVFY